METALGEYLVEAPVFVRTLSGTIIYWTRGAQNFYGYSWEEAVGKSSHELLKTVFPAALEDINRHLLAQGKWEGLLQHTRKDGLPVWSQSHWRAKGSSPDSGQLVVVETNADVTHREVLGRELTHRIKNMLAVVSAIARLSLRSCNKQDLNGFHGRLSALALAQDMLLSHQWEYGELGEIVQQTVKSLGMEERVDVHGEYVALSPNSVFAYTLTIHELLTNAIKHGSLSVPEGRVEINWSVASDARDRIHFVWRERGGPPVKPPEQTGFGATLLGKLLAADLGNSPVQLHFNPDGLVAVIGGTTQKSSAGTVA